MDPTSVHEMISSLQREAAQARARGDVARAVELDVAVQRVRSEVAREIRRSTSGPIAFAA